MKEVLITSSALIVALMLLRLVFSKKVSRTLIYGAWILVALRLLIPVQIGQLQFSVLTATQDVQQTVEQVATRPVSGPSKQEVYQDIVVDYVEKDQTVFIPQVQEQIREEISHGTTNPADIADKIQQKYPQQDVFVPQVQQQVQQQVEETETSPTLGEIAKDLWLLGIGVMALWFLTVNLRHGWLLRKTARKLDCKSPIPVYASDKVASPCLVGLARPVVYVTPRCAEKPQLLDHVLKHELTHHRHGDHIWSLVRCVCLCIYWFNPLVWAAAYLSRRDCELACDEGAMKGLGEAERLAYGKTLLEVVSHAANPGNLLQTATAMNETMKQLKERVNFIVRKPKFSITAAICMVLVCALIAGCVAAGPTSTQTNPPATTPTTTPATTPTSTPTTAPAENDIAWVMEGTLMLADGTVAGSVPLTVTGTIQFMENNMVRLAIDIELPDYFRYSYGGRGSDAYICIRQHETLGYYVSATFCYDRKENAPTFSRFALDAEKKCIILTWEDGTGRYLVASANPNTDTKTVFDHFAEFREKFAFSANGNTQPPEPVDEELAKFNALFGDVHSLYNKALTCEYETPAQLSLMYFFLSAYKGSDKEASASERAELKAVYGYGEYIDHVDVKRLPVDWMNQVLTELFGITLEDVEDAGFYDMDYLESTNCYYIVGGGASFARDFNALSVEYMEDGSLRVTYTQCTGSNDEMFVVTLMPYGDGYRILSNVRVE